MSWQVGLYVAAVFLPLAAFTVQILGIRFLGRLNAYIATGAIATSFVLSLIGFIAYFSAAEGVFEEHGGGEAHASAEGEHATEAKPHHKAEPLRWAASFDWVSLGQGTRDIRNTEGLTIPLGVSIDNLAVIMFLMVTFIATLIHIYSMGYMHDDPRYPRFFAYLSLFCFSMLALVASSSVFAIFMSWELVGVCSYFLIGFWYEDKKNCDAANKAFITNRIGDVGMLMGLGLLWSAFGTFDIHQLNTTLRDKSGHLHISAVASEAGNSDAGNYDVVTLHDPESDKPLMDDQGRPSQIPFWVLTLAGLGIFAGCAGKSAQFPLHVWLPDAMAGPTPVSALIHAATMVAAGVYLVGRFFPLFTEPALLYIGYTGGITLFIAATIAVVQSDYKKVLAYSTVSQLGFMMLALGVGGWAAGLFHLLTHAFFKALLFLGAGSVYHSVHTYEMPVLGGLYPKMKWTALTMLAATMAISGVPFFSGFYSKDAILAASIHFVFHEGNYQHILLFLLPAVGAAITAFYMFRMWFLVFAGESRSAHIDASHADPHGHDHSDHGHADHGHGDPVAHAHESGPSMLWPLFALAIPAIAVGWPMFIVPFSGEPLLEMMLAYGSPLPVPDLGNAHVWALVSSLIIATAGIGLAVLYYLPGYKKYDPAKVAHRFSGVNSFLQHKWYFDELYSALFVRPTLALARNLSKFDKSIVDGIVNTSAGLTVLVSKLEGFFDKFAVDGLVNLTAKIIYVLGDLGRGLQTGKLRNYLMVLACTVLLLFSVVFAWIGRGI